MKNEAVLGEFKQLSFLNSA